MAILVLGGAGYIGSHMVDRLVNEGQEKVVVVDSLKLGYSNTRTRRSWLHRFPHGGPFGQ